jgi:protein KRI1
LAGQKEDLTDNTAKKELKPLRDFWNSEQLDENEKFLRDFILNKGTSDLSLQVWNSNPKDHRIRIIRSYFIMSGFKDRHEGESESEDEEEDLKADERLLAEQEEFEHKYNFRYEEPDQVRLSNNIFVEVINK